MYRIVLDTPDADQVRVALTGVPHQIVSVALQGRVRTQKVGPSEARGIYETYSRGATAIRTAEAHGVSAQTVLRIAANPAHYGVAAAPIRRVFRGN